MENTYFLNKFDFINLVYKVLPTRLKEILQQNKKKCVSFGEINLDLYPLFEESFMCECKIVQLTRDLTTMLPSV